MATMEPMVVIVTGGGRGIGRAICHAYARNGARVAIAERDETTGRTTEREIRDEGGMAQFVQTDVGIPEQIAPLMDETVGLYGRIDVMVNNAGFGRKGSPYDLSVSDWDDVMATNLRGAFLCARESARRMKANGGGSIVNIGSIRATMPDPESVAYAASKGGVIALTLALASALAPDRIRVNCVSPGWIETPANEGASEPDDDRHRGRLVGQPDDIARACLYLSDPANDFITGVNLVVDGGITRRLVYD